MYTLNISGHHVKSDDETQALVKESENDLECFIGEFIIVISNIGEAINQPMSLSDKQITYKKLLIAFSEELNIPIQIPL